MALMSALAPPDPRTRLPDGPPDPASRLPDEEGLPAGVPPLPTVTPMREPPGPDLGPLSQREEDRLYGAMLRVDDTLDRARANAAQGGGAAEARTALRVSGQTGLGPEVYASGAKAHERAQQSDVLDRKLAQLPRLASYMAQSPQHAAALRGEIDRWGTLDYVFGKYGTEVDRAAQVAAAIKRGGRDVDRDLQALHRGDVQEVPGWLLAYGRAAYATATSVQSWWRSMYAPENVDQKEIVQARGVAAQPVPGDDSAVLRKVNSLVGMAPLIGAAMIHPGAAFGLMYAETSGRTYEDLRLGGFEHEAARDVSNLIGFTTASVGSALGGPLFKLNFLAPLKNLGLAAAAPNAVANSILKSPTAWRVFMDLGKNFAAAMTMNVAQAASEVSLKEAFQSAAEGRSFDASRVVDAGRDAANAWAELGLLSVVPTYRAHAARVEARRAAVEPVPQSPADALAERVHDAYEQRGHAIRSMQAASDLAAAVTALKGSEFMRDNPAEARDLIRQMTAPRATQSVFVAPEALSGLTDDSRALLGPLDMAAGRVPVPLVDFLAHPEAEALLPHVAGEADLLTPSEAAKVDFRSAPDLPRPTTPEAKLPRSQKAFRAWADDAVSRRPTGELDGLVSDHRKRAADAAAEATQMQRDATDRAKAGEATSTKERRAREARRAAAVSTAMHEAASRAQAEVDGIVGDIGERTGAAARGRAWAAGPDYGEAHDAIEEMLGIAQPRGHAAPDLSDLHTKLVREDKLSQDWDLAATNRLLRERATPRELSVADLREVHRALVQVSDAARAESSLNLAGKQRASAEVTAQIKTYLSKFPDVPEAQRATTATPKSLTVVQRAGVKLAEAKASINQPHTLMFKLGPAGDSLWFDKFVAGVSREERMWGQAEAHLRVASEAVSADVRASAADIVPPPAGAEAWGARARSDVWHLALHLGAEGADVKIAERLGVEPVRLHEWLDRYLGRTPAEAREVMAKLVGPHWRVFDALQEDLVRAHVERGLPPPDLVRGRKLIVHGQEYEGGYAGRMRWLDLSDRPVPETGTLETFLADDGSKPFSFGRRGGDGLPVLSWEGIPAALRKSIHDVALMPFVEDAHKIFSDPAVRTTLARKMTRQAVDEIYDPSKDTSWLHVVARGSVADVHSAQAFTRAAMKLQGAAAYSAFSLNFRVMGGQLSHILGAMPGLGIAPDHMASGVNSAFDPERRRWAHANSEVLSLRYEDYQRRAEELNRQMTGVEPGGGDVRSFTDHENWTAWQEMDAFVSHTIWEAAYARATSKWRLGEGVSHETAVREADKAVTKMMPAQDVYDQASFVRDRSLAGFTYLVRNFPNTLANVAALNWWEAKATGKPLDKAKAAAMTAGMLMAVEVVGKGLLMQGGAPENKDASSWWAEHAAASLFYPYMLADPALALYHAAQSDRQEARRDIGRLTPAALSVVTSGLDDVARLAQDGDEEAAYRAGAHLLGLILRSPIPMKTYDVSNAARNSEDAADALKKGLGYRR